MNLFRLYRHDFKNGLLRWRYLAAVGLWLVPTLIMFDMLQFYNDSGTLGDYLLYIFRGMEAVESMGALEKIQLPIPWLVVVGGSLYISLDYLQNDLTTAGQQIMVRCHSRKMWYLSKCLWNISNCFVYFGIGLMVPAIFSLTGGSLELSPSSELTASLFWFTAPIELSGLCVFTIAVVLPFLTMAALNMLQMTLCLFLKPIFSFLSCVCLLITSLFWCSPFSLGNGAMTLRSSVMTDNGIKPLVSAVICLAVLFVCVIVGTMKFQSYDILGVEE